MVGGKWSASAPSNAQIPLDTRFDVRHVSKAKQMMEFLVWDCGLASKIPLSVCSVPVEHSFKGSLSGYRSSLYVLELVGKVLASNQGTVKCLLFDAATCHSLVRQVMFGDMTDVIKSDVEAVPFFGSLRFRPMPKTVLPRLPVEVALENGEPIYAFPGICDLAGFATPFIL